MEDDKIKDLFQSFQPELLSDSQFISKLVRNMDAVEIVKQQATIMRKRNRIAVVVAALSGFVMGVILTLLFPLIGDAVTTFNLSLANFTMFDLRIDWRVAGWLVTAVVCALTAINAYEITLSLLPESKRIHSYEFR